MAETIAAFLIRDGYDVEHADSLAKAREHLDRSSFDLIILDITLPDGDGRHLLPVLEQIGRPAVVIVSGRGGEQDRVFSLTPRILVLAGGFLQGRRFGKAIEPVLRAFAHRIGESISMAMIDGYDAVYVAHAGGNKSMVSIGFTVGSRVPLLSTAIGRALVAFSSPERTKKILADAPLQKFTPTTVDRRSAIRKDLAAAVERGFAFADGEFEAGVAAVAVPVRPQSGEIAALGVSASSARFKSEPFRRSIVETLNECSNAVGGLL